MDTQDFYKTVYAAVRQIPPGFVSTYGRIAALIGRPGNARLVGRALSSAPPGHSIPAHRVVSSSGALVPGWAEQVQKLIREGVFIKENGRVDLKKHLWPRQGSEGL